MADARGGPTSSARMVIDMPDTNPLPDCLSHLRPMQVKANAQGLREAAAYVEEQKALMPYASVGYRWATGVHEFLRQVADGRERSI